MCYLLCQKLLLIRHRDVKFKTVKLVVRITKVVACSRDGYQCMWRGAEILQPKIQYNIFEFRFIPLNA